MINQTKFCVLLYIDVSRLARWHSCRLLFVCLCCHLHEWTGDVARVAAAAPSAGRRRSYPLASIDIKQTTMNVRQLRKARLQLQVPDAKALVMLESYFISQHHFTISHHPLHRKRQTKETRSTHEVLTIHQVTCHENTTSYIKSNFNMLFRRKRLLYTIVQKND